MKDDFHEDDELRSVTLENARGIFLARRRAEEELARAREALSSQAEWLRVTLASIGDAVLTTDTEGRVLSLNRVAESLTGWAEHEAKGRPLVEVLRLVGEESRQPVEDPAGKALREGRVVGMANRTILVARDGTEIPIDDSAAPIRDEQGRVLGVVLTFRSVAERTRADEVQARLAAIVESSQDAIVSKTLEGIITSWNAGAEHLFGYRADEVVGSPVSLLIPPERQDEEREILGQLRRGERIEHYETVRVSKQGRRIDVSLTISPVRDRAGRVIGASKIARDITARKRSDQRLATQSRVTHALAESVSLEDAAPKILQAICEELDWTVAALWSADEGGKAMRCSVLHHVPAVEVPRFEAACRERAFERGVGLPGRVWASGQAAWVSDVTRDANLPRAAVAAAEGLRSALAVPIVLDNRVLGVLETFGQEVREPDPHLLQVMKAIGSQVGQFIERKRAEDALREREQKTRFLAEASAALADLTDQESTLQKVASLAVPHFADWCAVDVPDADGYLRRLAVSHVDPAKVSLVRELDRRFPSRPSETRGVRQVIRTGKPEWAASVTGEMLAAFTQGEEHLRIVRELKPKSYVCVPLKSRTRVLGALTFVTSESGRAYDADDVRAAEDLAHRTVIAIENASLLAALRDADRRKNEFLAMLAHELRNPLAPINNAVQIFRAKGPPVPELQWGTEVIGRQVHQLTRLVDDLLDVSRITRGKIELRREIVELSTVVGSAVEASRPLIEKWDHELTVTIPARPIFVDADPTRLAQVVSNLLNNAAKYTDRGGRIALTADQQGENVAIRVRDTGIGIAAEMRPRIFELFTQVNRSMERSEGGLGIGLTLVQRLVEMHGGSVEALSDGPGKGSEFVVRLPVAHAAASERPASGERAPGEGPRALRILVVDDNHDAADSLGMLLRMTGNEVHTAHDGVEAVGAAAAFHPDVVLLDLGLPKLDGYEVADRIREQKGGPEVLLVALTGWGRAEDRRRSREAGFDHHMTKPVDFKALQQFLAEASRARLESRRTPPEN